MATTPTAPATPPQMPNISYSLNPETGELTRTDSEGTVLIAVYEHDTGTVVFESREIMKFRSPALQYLNSTQVPYKSLALKGAKRDIVDDSKIPPPPKQTLEAGDKTPAYVEWLRQFKPEEYAIRYGIRGEGTIQQVSYTKDEKTGRRITHVTEKAALIADRKTHLTEKPEANDGPAS